MDSLPEVVSVVSSPASSDGSSLVSSPLQRSGTFITEPKLTGGTRLPPAKLVGLHKQKSKITFETPRTGRQASVNLHLPRSNTSSLRTLNSFCDLNISDFTVDENKRVQRVSSFLEPLPGEPLSRDSSSSQPQSIQSEGSIFSLPLPFNSVIRPNPADFDALIQRAASLLAASENNLPGSQANTARKDRKSKFRVGSAAPSEESPRSSRRLGNNVRQGSVLWQLEQKLNLLRSNHAEFERFQEQIVSYKEEKSSKHLQMKSATRDVMLEHRRSLSEFLPEIHQQKRAERIEENAERMKQVAAERQRLEQELMEHRLSAMKRQEQIRMARQKQVEAAIRARFWLTLMTVVKVTPFGQLIVRERTKRILMKTYDKAARTIQHVFHGYYRRQSDSKKGWANKIIRRTLLKWIRRRRITKKIHAISLIRTYLIDVQQAFYIPMVMKKFRASCIQIQRMYRQHRQVTIARFNICLMKWNKITNMMLDDLDRRIQTQKAKELVETLNRPGQKLNDKQKLQLEKKMAMKSSDAVVAMLVAKEEIRKIPEESKEELLRAHLNRVAAEYYKNLRIYKDEKAEYDRFMEFERARNQIAKTGMDSHQEKAANMLAGLLNMDKDPEERPLVPSAATTVFAKNLTAFKKRAQEEVEKNMTGLERLLSKGSIEVTKPKETKVPVQPRLKFIPSDDDIRNMIQEVRKVSRSLMEERLKHQAEGDADAVVASAPTKR